MAFSQVEIAPSSPFGCVLRDHNRRDPWSRESNARATFQKNLKDLVQSCISAPPRISDSDSHENSDCNNNNNTHRTSTINDRWARAREMVFPIDRRGQEAENSALSFEIPNLGGVSSIVQRWRDFEAEAKNLNSPVCSSRSNSGSTFTENASFVEAIQGGSEACESVDEKYGTPTMTDDSFVDWESDRTAPSGPTSSWGRDSDDTERERLRVADIIRKLSSANQLQQGSLTAYGDNNIDREQSVGNEHLPQVRTALDKPEQIGLSPVISSSRIRGRQAFSDLLMQMERDRHRELEGLEERKAVSRFSQRGRIQALLRVRFLRRGPEVRDCRHSNSTTPKSNGLTQRSIIMHLRERFSTGVEHGAADSRSTCKEVVDDTPDVQNSSTSNRLRDLVDSTPGAENSSSSSRLREEYHHQEVTDSRSAHREVVDNTPDLERSFSSNQLKKDIYHEYVSKSVQNSTPRVQYSENFHEETTPRSDVMWQGTSYEVNNFGSQESADLVITLNGGEENRNAEGQEADYQQLIGSNHDWINHTTLPRYWEEQEANQSQLIETDHDSISHDSHPWSEWEEQQFNNQQLVETSHDWISDISRPRGDWEGLRQARYQEMLDPYLENGDIRQLLERRSVSTFLSSGLRGRIDQLMISRTQRQPHQIGHQVEEEKHEEEVLAEGEEEEKEVEEEEEEEEDDDDEEQLEEEEEAADGEDGDDDEKEDGDNESSIWNRYDVGGEYVDQTTSSLQPHLPPLLRSWSRNGENEVSDNSDHVASPSLQQSLSSSSYSQDNQQCSSFRNHHPIEMELMYDLREHMEQLHQEMSELRKSVKSCMKMQVKLQRSIKQEVAAAVIHSVQRREGKDSLSMFPRKGSCCVCWEKEVDSLLYRCGHMCTCLKCAHELQWSSGKCPICVAPIVDVVRAYADDR